MTSDQSDPYCSPTSFNDVLDAERAAIAARTGRDSSKIWVGVALSGGGIRSASFCLGALQALARCGWLHKVDYISTVSGGGYTGGGLQWLLHRNARSGDAAAFPYGLDAQVKLHSRQQSDLQFLRWHANYLLPGNGLTIFSAIAVVLRTILLSLLIWLPVLTAAFLLIQVIFSQATVMCFASRHLPAEVFSNAKSGICADSDDQASRICRVIPIAASWTAGTETLCREWAKPKGDKSKIDIYAEGNPFWPDRFGFVAPIYAIALYAAGLSALLLPLLALVVAFVGITKFPQALSKTETLVAFLLGAVGARSLWVGGSIAVAAFAQESPTIEDTFKIAFYLAVGLAFILPFVNLLGLVIFRERYKNAEYFLRRVFEIFGGLLFQTVIYASITASIPFVASYAVEVNWISKTGGAATALSGLASAVLGHLSQSRAMVSGRFSQYLAAILAGIFLYGVIVGCYVANVFLFHLTDTAGWYTRTFAVVLTLAAIFGCLANSNSIGLHRFYRDRLMELFMPSTEALRERRARASYAADRLAMSDLWRGSQKPLELFPIVNCNAILVNDKDPVLARRGGTNFAITPLHLGSDVHGWEKTDAYERKNRPIYLATAVAASGAAANANAGYVGTGVTRNRVVSLVLMLFNIRLGVWIRRPSQSKWPNLVKPTPFFPTLWYGFLGRGYRSTSEFVELSDGGHFDNLAIYELVRRRVGVILAFDGEADAGTALPALTSLARRLEEDFGATLTFDVGLNELMPSVPAETTYPNETKFALSPFAKGTITYADDEVTRTTLIYVKASLTKDMPFSLRGYRAQNPSFPNEPTSDQFYSPEQFDAYRELGEFCANNAVSNNLNLFDKRNFGGPITPLKE